jgi:hypothetical protein
MPIRGVARGADRDHHGASLAVAEPQLELVSLHSADPSSSIDASLHRIHRRSDEYATKKS